MGKRRFLFLMITKTAALYIAHCVENVKVSATTTRTNFKGHPASCLKNSVVFFQTIYRSI